jgi:RNA polymerase sigma factor (sigma-70 family)
MRRESARLSGRDDAFCADVVQDAMMRVIRSLRPMDEKDGLQRWLHVVVRSCVYDRLRADLRRQAREHATVTPSLQPDPDLQGRIRWLEQELRSVGDANAELLLMRYRFGWTLQQIGTALGLKPGAVDGRLRRLLGTLRRRERGQHHG